MVDTQGLDLVEGQQDTDEEHLVLFLQGQGKAIDDAARQEIGKAPSSGCRLHLP